MRKFTTEFSINSYCQHSSLLQQQELDIIDNIYPSDVHYHIYIIGRRPRISILPETVTFSDKSKALKVY